MFMSELMLLGVGASTFCGDTYEILQLVGWVLTIFKIVIPLIIIALGLIDLGKAAVSSKPEEIKKTATSLAWRVAGGILIFFVPTIVMVVFGFVNKFSEASDKADFSICRACVESPWSENCHGYNS